MIENNQNFFLFTPITIEFFKNSSSLIHHKIGIKFNHFKINFFFNCINIYINFKKLMRFRTILLVLMFVSLTLKKKLKIITGQGLIYTMNFLYQD